ncbi:unnamed protein product [Peniophora sp. CBMAI 1063]|nr:unnamed protein product [Peniophora sp. CBMAI 1063]
MSTPSDWNTALEVYTNTTGVDLLEHSSAKHIADSVSSDAVISVIQDELAHCAQYRADSPEWEKLRRKLAALANVVFELNGALSESTTSTMPGGQTVLVAICDLTTATDGVSETYAALAELLDKIERSLQRLSPSTTAYIFDALFATLAVLAIAYDSVKEIPRKLNDWTEAIFGDEDMKNALSQLEKVAARGTGLSLAGERAKQIGKNAVDGVKKGVENVYDLMRVSRLATSNRADSQSTAITGTSSHDDADTAPAYDAPALEVPVESLLESPPPVYAEHAPGLDASGKPWTQDVVSAFISDQCNTYLSVFKLLGISAPQAKAIRAYAAPDDQPIGVSFEEGEHLEILGMSPSKWIIRKADGIAGILRGTDFFRALELEYLSNPGLVGLEGDAEKVIALRDYTASTTSHTPDEISCSLGEIMDVVNKSDAQWTVRKTDGTIGTVPSDVLQVIETTAVDCTVDDAEKAVQLLQDDYAMALEKWGPGGAPCSVDFLQNFTGMLNVKKADIAAGDSKDLGGSDAPA